MASIESFGILWQPGQLYKFHARPELPTRQLAMELLSPYYYGEGGFPEPWLDLDYLKHLKQENGSLVKPDGIFMFIKSIVWKGKNDTVPCEFICILFNGKLMVIDAYDFKCTFATIIKTK